MTWLTTALGFLKTAWPYLSLVLSLLGGIHAGSAAAQIPTGPEASISQQADRATHVYGVGAIAAAAGVAGLTGIGINHGKLASAPSVAPVGVSAVVHRMDELHSEMLSDPKTTKSELTALNELIMGRVVLPPTVSGEKTP